MTQDPSAKDRALGPDLGMDRPISRRDMLHGAGAGLAAGIVAAVSPAWADADTAAPYPPTLTGLRGSHPGSFETAHALRDGAFWDQARPATDTDGAYDLVVVGAGISGLSAAYFYRQAKPDARILILDNHDDFGGHARRNEFWIKGRLHLMNAGTLEIDSPRPYSAVSAGLLKDLGIAPAALSKACDRPEIYQGLGSGVFFDKETFGTDRVVVGGGAPWEGGGDAESWRRFARLAPLSPKAQADLVRLETGQENYLPGLTSAQKKDRLSRISYLDFLLTLAKVDPSVAAFYQARTHGEWGVGIDAEPALDCWVVGMPGFDGMKLEPGSAPRMGNTAAGYADGGSEKFHFPDGNTTIARLLVRRLVPGVLPETSLEGLVTARADYGALDRAGSPVRIRLSSTVVGARNLGGPAASRGVEIAYAKGGQVYRVHALNCVMAGWNMMIPYLCPDLPEAQKEALHKLVKVPLVYTSVAISNWRAFKALGVQNLYCPGAYFSSVRLNWPVDIGAYAAARSPDEPILLHLTRTPCAPGLVERDQHRAGRAELLATPFETFERNVRDQLGRMLGPSGFDPAADILAITVNRWPHGYAYEYNPLFDPDVPLEQRPHMIGRQRFGRIAIANSDSGAAAYTDSAIDQARRAVDELLAA
ncbi:MAG: FAD-dependent oxidoreductase [Caulobacteraceae bacterium]|nr:FAD-dependent oxidoreductase [Caulobacteraceae bacterium]